MTKTQIKVLKRLLNQYKEDKITCFDENCPDIVKINDIIKDLNFFYNDIIGINEE